MNNNRAVDLLSILGSEIRLPIFRMLMQAGEKGLNPKFISDKLDIKPNKLSFHLNNLKKCNLVNSKKDGRELIYSTNYETAKKLVDFLFENCCKDDGGSCGQGSKSKC